MITKPFIFVLMPFNSEFDDIYKLGIKETCEELQAYCERVDEQIFEENILDRIYNQINKADIIIADLTNKNPNVFYETGYAHALGKKVILLTQKSEDIPFDLKHHFHIIYNGKILKLKEELKKRVEWFLKHPKLNELPNELNIELFINGNKLTPGAKITIESKYHPFLGSSGSVISLKIDLHNNSQNIFNSVIKLGVITNYGLNKNNSKGKYNIIRLNEKDYLHLSPEFSQIFPSAWETFEMKLYSDLEQDLWEKELSFTIRLFTEFGVKDYPIFITYKKVSTDLDIF